MPLRLLLAAVVLAATAQTVASQAPLRSIERTAFRLAVVPWVSLGFNGVRATRDDPDQDVCVTRGGDECVSYKLGSGPMLGVDVQVPIAGNFALQLGGAAGRPSRVFCTRGQACNSTDDVTVLRGSGLVLFRIKPQAPIYFGIGGAYSRLDPGVVPAQQEDAVTETGGVIAIGYDFSMGSRVGARVAWTHYLMRPSGADLGQVFEARSLTHDWLLAVGARVRVGG